MDDRQVPVQDDHVGIDNGQALLCRRPVEDPVHGHGMTPEPVRDCVCQLSRIFHHQNPQRRLPPVPMTRRCQRHRCRLDPRQVLLQVCSAVVAPGMRRGVDADLTSRPVKWLAGRSARGFADQYKRSIHAQATGQ